MKLPLVCCFAANELLVSAALIHMLSLALTCAWNIVAAADKVVAVEDVAC
jgi:hypothetical protein